MHLKFEFSYSHLFIILKKGKCGFEHVSIGRGICEGKSGI